MNMEKNQPLSKEQKSALRIALNSVYGMSGMTNLASKVYHNMTNEKLEVEEYFILIEHNSDRIVNVIVGRSENEILEKIFDDYSTYNSIINRLNVDNVFDLDSLKDCLDGSLYLITELFHDGDSENGYTLVKA